MFPDRFEDKVKNNQIQNLKIQNLKIQNLKVQNLKVQNLKILPFPLNIYDPAENLEPAF